MTKEKMEYQGQKYQTLHLDPFLPFSPPVSLHLEGEVCLRPDGEGKCFLDTCFWLQWIPAAGGVGLA